MFTEHLDFIYKKSSTTRLSIHKEMFDCVSDILKHQNEQSKLPLFTLPCILPLYVNFEAISMLCIIF